MIPHGAPTAARYGSPTSRARVAPMNPAMHQMANAQMSATRWLDGAGHALMLGTGIDCATFTGIKRVTTGSLGEDTT